MYWIQILEELRNKTEHLDFSQKIRENILASLKRVENPLYKIDWTLSTDYDTLQSNQPPATGRSSKENAQKMGKLTHRLGQLHKAKPKKRIKGRAIMNLGQKISLHEVGKSKPNRIYTLACKWHYLHTIFTLHLHTMCKLETGMSITYFPCNKCPELLRTGRIIIIMTGQDEYHC